MADSRKLSGIGKVMIYIFLIGLLLGADQFTKYLASGRLQGEGKVSFLPHIISFFYLENEGMAWGMLSGKIVLFVILTCILTAGIVFVMFRAEKLIQKKQRRIYTVLQADLAVLTAGAIGNLVDRVKNGYVVDFIKTEFIEFPVFNLADCYVTVSMLLLIVVVLFFINEEEMNILLSFQKITEKGRGNE